MPPMPLPPSMAAIISSSMPGGIGSPFMPGMPPGPPIIAIIAISSSSDMSSSSPKSSSMSIALIFGTLAASMVEPSGMMTGPSEKPMLALKKLSNEAWSSSIETSSPCSARISSSIPLSSICSRKNSSSTPEPMNSSMSMSVSSASPVASYTRFFSGSDSTAYASAYVLNTSGSPPLSGWCLRASLRYAFLISSAEAVSVRPRRSYMLSFVFFGMANCSEGAAQSVLSKVEGSLTKGGSSAPSSAFNVCFGCRRARRRRVRRSR